MDHRQWNEAVDRSLKAAGRDYRVGDILVEERADAYESGESPVIFAKRLKHTLTTDAKPQDQPPVIPVAQHPSVLSDPKYLLDTGVNQRCPICGSTFVKPISKPGTGLSYFGSLQFVVGASLVESVVRQGQPQPYVCGYCEAVFTKGADEPAPIQQ